MFDDTIKIILMIEHKIALFKFSRQLACFDRDVVSTSHWTSRLTEGEEKENTAL